MTNQTLIERIAQMFAVGLHEDEQVQSGDFVSIHPAHILTHDNTGAIIPKFQNIGVDRILDPRQPVFALDHNIQDTSVATRNKYEAIRAFAIDQQVDFYPAGRGIGHQIMVEEGYAWPSTLVVASDSHANMYGGLGCLGTPIVRTDAAGIWATGKTWWQIPPVVKITLTGELRFGVTGKDVMLALCSHFNKDEVLNHALEFHGAGVETLSVDQRLSMANMSTEWGALAGLFPADTMTVKWFEQRLEAIQAFKAKHYHPRITPKRIEILKQQIQDGLFLPGPDSSYTSEIKVDLSTVIPMVAGPHDLKTAVPASKIREMLIVIQKAYLVSCVNARVEDLTPAAVIIGRKKVAPHVKFYFAAASSLVQKTCEAQGTWQTLIHSGAKPLPPGCGPCIGLGEGLMEDGETGISATNRNFKGRMGSKNSEVYLASPAVVAQSALSGYINCPPALCKYDGPIRVHRSVRPQMESHDTLVQIMEGFPESITGELVYCPADNMNTDAIYPGKYTYQDDFTLEQQAKVVMENYDPAFGRIVKKGDILIGGTNFGTGSSREQAATALKYKGIQLVIAGSFSETYKRNALNNGFLLLEIPRLVDVIKLDFGTERLTARTGMKVRIDFIRSSVTFQDWTYSFRPVGRAAQELIVLDGLAQWIKENLTDE
ncbi:homoaconitase [candidate division KSB1 bacterium]|nr:homoaconitase [candidate division KSB1 bacterium]